MSRPETKTEVGVGVTVSTGISALDSMTGGFPNGSVILMAGEPGSGHEIFAQQILYSKAVSNEAQATYFAVERPIEDISSEMLGRQWDVDALMGHKSWEYVDAYSVRQNVIKGAAGAKVLLDLLEDRLSKSIKDGRWTAIDTFSHFILNYDEKDVIPILDDVIGQARERGGLHMLLAVKGLHDQKDLLRFAHHLDGYFEFNLASEESDPIGTIRIRKLRRASHMIRNIPYRITEEGLVIETAVRIA